MSDLAELWWADLVVLVELHAQDEENEPECEQHLTEPRISVGNLSLSEHGIGMMWCGTWSLMACAPYAPMFGIALGLIGNTVCHTMNNIK